MNSNENEIQVSVCVVTYNQEEYIAECLESLVSQKTNFKFEIIVGEDCSTDNTRAVVQQYANKYPNLIVPLFYEKNVGAVENVKQVYKKAQGKYIAHMDGDDMALPNKLQKQFDIMEENPQAIICSHNVLEICDNDTRQSEYWNHPKGEYNLLDLIKKLPFFAHSSKIFRVKEDVDLSSVLSNKDALDIELHLYQSTKGSIMHLDENLGVYRTGVGISAVRDSKLNYKMIKRVEGIYEKLMVTNPEILREIKEAYASYLLGIASSFAVIESNKQKMREYTFKSINQRFFSKKQVMMSFLILNPRIGISILQKRFNIKNKKS